jgi:hypothetical protein
MPNMRIEQWKDKPLLDIASYARRGPGRRDHLTASEIALIERTVHRVPEAMVKVLPKDSNRISSVARHLNYIGRKGDLELETDDGERLRGKDAGLQLVEDWDLGLDEYRRDGSLSSVKGRAPKLVHKIMLSMPAGTPATGVLEAARNFAREQFALKHRYALALHTDEPHPHVHLVVKAVSEQGERLNIRKATLREWRSEFARHLREQGISANATERAVRGQSRTTKSDGIYRAIARGESTHLRERVEGVAGDLRDGKVTVGRGKTAMTQTRSMVTAGWHAAQAALEGAGRQELARFVRTFAERMPSATTEREQLLEQLSAHLPRTRSAVKQPTR